MTNNIKNHEVVSVAAKLAVERMSQAVVSNQGAAARVYVVLSEKVRKNSKVFKAFYVVRKIWELS